MDSVVRLLEKVSLFAGLDEHILDKIVSIAVKKTYKKNETIFHQHDKGSALFVLQSGMVKIALIDKSGRQTILKIIEKDDFFGEMSLLDGRFRSASIIAMEDCEALLIFREDLINLIKLYPLISLNMLALLSRRFRETDEKIASLTFLDALGKVARVLLDFVADRGVRDNGHILLDLPFSRQEISEMAGVSRETLIRIFQKFRAMGCLKLDNKKIIILDEQFLKNQII
ncbi:MAG: Crp/Fnr family transcriptional regulator [Candidatus Anammoxibacter sp.]